MNTHYGYMRSGSNEKGPGHSGYMRGGSGGGQSSGWAFTGLFSLAGLVAVYWVLNAN